MSILSVMKRRPFRLAIALLTAALLLAGCANEDPVSNKDAGEYLCGKHKGVRTMHGDEGDQPRSAVCMDGTIWDADLYYHGEGDTGKAWNDPSTITGRDNKKAER